VEYLLKFKYYVDEAYDSKDPVKESCYSCF
jgi:hypothetical protein